MENQKKSQQKYPQGWRRVGPGPQVFFFILGPPFASPSQQVGSDRGNPPARARGTGPAIAQTHPPPTKSQPRLPQTLSRPPKYMSPLWGSLSPTTPAGVGHGRPRGTDLDQVGGEALGPQPLLEAMRAAQGALQAAGLGLQQGGADALVGPVVAVLGSQPGDVNQPPALGIVGVVARVAEQVAGGQL